MPSVTLLVGTRKGAFVLESDADRDQWTVSEPLLAGWDVANLLYDDRGGPSEGAVFAGVGHFVYGPTIHRAPAIGEEFEQVPEGPAFPTDGEFELNQVWTVAPGHADEPEVLYAGVDEAALFVSRDGGDSWSEVTGLTAHPSREDWFPGKGGLCVHSIRLDPTDPERLWVGISAVGVFRTADGGETWALCNDGLEVAAPSDEHEGIGSCVHRLVGHPTDPDLLYQQNHMGVYRSSDGADTWERIDDGLPSEFGFPMVMHPHEPDTLYVAPIEGSEARLAIDGEPAVYRTTDAGDNWERLDEGLPSNAWVTILRHAMAVDTCDSPGVYVGTTGGQIYASTDEGESWETLDLALPRINSLTAVVRE